MLHWPCVLLHHDSHQDVLHRVFSHIFLSRCLNQIWFVWIKIDQKSVPSWHILFCYKNTYLLHFPWLDFPRNDSIAVADFGRFPYLFPMFVPTQHLKMYIVQIPLCSLLLFKSTLLTFFSSDVYQGSFKLEMPRTSQPRVLSCCSVNTMKCNKVEAYSKRFNNPELARCFWINKIITVQWWHKWKMYFKFTGWQNNISIFVARDWDFISFLYIPPCNTSQAPGKTNM